MNKHIITCVAVNWWGKDFADLLINTSLLKSTHPTNIEIVIVDNSGELKEEDYVFYEKEGANIKIIKPEKNLGHGKGMDLGIQEAQGEYILAMDIDAHILLQDWDEKLVEYYTDKDIRLLGAEGCPLKPMRPAVMFFRKDWFMDNKMSFEAREFDGVKFDVGQHFYFKTLSLGGRAEFLRWKKNEYKDCMGEEYSFFNERAFFHHWWGTRFFGPDGTVVHKEVDGIPYEKLLDSKASLFNQVK
jgi:glycosyltransferase involved in cell wall biosynthesis